MRGSFIKPVEEKSSPSHIVATKGSSVWLHWNYTYTGDALLGYKIITYREQKIGFQTSMLSTFQALATRVGRYGTLTLESPAPAPFHGRVEVISSNSTLVIHGLQYNDSNYQFSSSVRMRVEQFPILSGNTSLKPVVRISVNGT